MINDKYGLEDVDKSHAFPKLPYLEIGIMSATLYFAKPCDPTCTVQLPNSLVVGVVFHMLSYLTHLWFESYNEGVDNTSGGIC